MKWIFFIIYWWNPCWMVVSWILICPSAKCRIVCVCCYYFSRFTLETSVIKIFLNNLTSKSNSAKYRFFSLFVALFMCFHHVMRIFYRFFKDMMRIILKRLLTLYLSMQMNDKDCSCIKGCEIRSINAFFTFSPVLLITFHTVNYYVHICFKFYWTGRNIFIFILWLPIVSLIYMDIKNIVL